MITDLAECLTYLDETNPEALRWNDCDAAIVGIAERCGQPTLLVYDYEKLVQCFVDQGASWEEAMEWVGYNIAGAWVGPHTPLILHRFAECSGSISETQAS